MDLSLLPVAFSLILTVASRFLHPYSTDVLNIYVNGEKSLHGERHPERFTVLCGEEKREERDRSDQEEKRGKSKGERAI